MDFLLVQLLTGLASASDLFLVAAGLSIIFGVTRVVNFAHGSFYMLGAYVAYSVTAHLPQTAMGFWFGVLVSAACAGLLGGLVEIVILRRIYRAPELFQLLATFGLVLVVQDLVLFVWGPEDRLGPRAPGLEGAVTIAGQSFPAYDLVLILLGPLVLVSLWLLFRMTRWGVLVRAATQDREMVAVLGINQSRLFTGVFMLGTFLAGLGGAVQLPREAIHHSMDLEIIVEAFVVVVVGGLGSVTGAYLAALIVGILNVFSILVLPEISIVLIFLVMAVVLVVRPWGLLGKPQGAMRTPGGPEERPLQRQSVAMRNLVFAALVGLALLPVLAGNYTLLVATEALIFVLFAASLQFLMGIGGMVSFGHAAYFGLGAYGAALLARHVEAPMEVALIAAPGLAAAGALLFGWFCVRLSGVYLAMLTLAFAQITWSVAFQWYDVTGGDNGILGVWPASWASSAATFYYLTLACVAVALVVLRRMIYAPFGFALRACRDSVMRAESLGLDRRLIQWLGFTAAGAFAGLAGSLYAYLKGSVFPDVLAIPISVDGLVMVLLGGVQTLNGPIVGAVVYKILQIILSSYTDYWRMVLGATIIALVVAFPQGIVGFLQDRFASPAETPEPPSA